MSEYTGKQYDTFSALAGDYGIYGPGDERGDSVTDFEAFVRGMIDMNPYLEVEVNHELAVRLSNGNRWVNLPFPITEADMEAALEELE
ncbi:MAG: hypothetical protein KC492_08485 [Myxococcales bacterium]|nr:hypothetical protein [Myxococcales bacterium]